MKIVKKLVKVGSNSLMIIIPEKAIEKLKLKEEDLIEADIKKIYGSKED